MTQKSWLSFLLLYLSWILWLALMQFWMQSQADFIGVAAGNILMLVFAGLFLAGCLYFLRYFTHQHRIVILWLILLWSGSYLLIEALSMLLFITLNREMIVAIDTSIYETKEILERLWLGLPAQFYELMTLKNATHLLDIVYTSFIELAVFSPLALFFIKKDCHKADKCV